MLGPLTYLDAGLLAIAGISGLLAMYRGFTREVLSILSWAVAAGATLYVIFKQKPLAQQLAQQFKVHEPIAQIGLGAVVFLVTLVIVHLITSRISDAILDSRVGMIDRLLGFGFGVGRGFLLVVIMFAFFKFLAPPEIKGTDAAAAGRGGKPVANYPVGIKGSRSLSLLESTSESLTGFVQRFIPSSLAPPAGGEPPAPREQQSG